MYMHVPYIVHVLHEIKIPEKIVLSVLGSVNTCIHAQMCMWVLTLLKPFSVTHAFLVRTKIVSAKQ